MCQHQAISYINGLQINRDACATCNQCTVRCLSNAIRVIGKEYTVDEVMEEILRDVDYYQTSGGGVTFSGGEPTLHTDFIYELLLQCKKHGIHTNIETNGYFARERFQKMLPLLDLIYFDIKTADTELLKQFLKQSNEKILFNIQQLVEVNAPVEFHIPLIPEYTANENNLNAITALLKKNGVKKIICFPIMPWAKPKEKEFAALYQNLNSVRLYRKEFNSFRNILIKKYTRHFIPIKTKCYECINRSSSSPN